MLALRTKRNSGGFTLIEIMIVIAIVAIFMTIGIPSLSRSFKKDDLGRAVRDTIEGCKTARDRAILQGVPWAFIVNENGTLNVQPVPQEDRGTRQVTPGAGEAKTVPAAPYSGFPRKLGEDVMVQMIDVNFVSHMERPDARVRFFPNGTADEFTVVYMWKGLQRNVTIDVVTGQATEYVRK